MKRLKNPGVCKEKWQSFILWLMQQANETLNQVALWLQRKSSGYSSKVQKRALLLFCIVSLSASGWALLQGLQNRSMKVPITPIQIIPIQPSATINPTHSGNEGMRIHRFKQYLDSLMKTPTRNQVLDSFLKQNPHLLKTLTYLENLYKEPQNKAYEK